jgi:hypothetical protein
MPWVSDAGDKRPRLADATKLIKPLTHLVGAVPGID